MHGDTTATTTGKTVPRDRFQLATRLGAGAAAIVLMLSLAACTGDPAPVASPTGGSTAASAPSIPPPTRPVEVATPESAIQFTRYFWDLYNYAYQTYDTAPLEAISDPACSFCSELIQDVTRTSDARTRISGYELSLKEATSPQVQISTGTLVIGVLSQKPGKATAPDGGTTELAGFKTVRSSVALKWNGSAWGIEGVTNDPKTRTTWGS